MKLSLKWVLDDLSRAKNSEVMYNKVSQNWRFLNHWISKKNWTWHIVLSRNTVHGVFILFYSVIMLIPIKYRISGWPKLLEFWWSVAQSSSSDYDTNSVKHNWPRPQKDPKATPIFARFLLNSVIISIFFTINYFFLIKSVYGMFI